MSIERSCALLSAQGDMWCKLVAKNLFSIDEIMGFQDFMEIFIVNLGKFFKFIKSLNQPNNNND